ncbi:MAG: amidase [Rubrivivax sp. SCN 71-131]|jgi:amidase|nr:MAG: amidase [Rubrivivax sp. SCN 71-131]
MRHDEYLRHDATALAALVRAGEVSAAELLELALARASAVQPRINALVRAMEEQARAQIAAGLQGPLAGVPFLLKDSLQDYAGVPTGHGSRALRHWVPTGHAATTRRFLDAGLVVFGKTNLPEFGLKGVSDSAFHGPVSNPWDLTRNAGGSSGGAAAAVAAGVLPMAAGSDGGGSLRIPAAFCGLFTLKPSRGRISEAPAFGEVWFGACTHGVLARSVRDSALALDVLCASEPGDPFVGGAPAQPFVQALAQPPGRLRIGYATVSPIGTPVAADAVAALEAAVALLRSLGHEVEPAAPVIDGHALARAYLTMYLGQTASDVDAARRLGAGKREFERLTRALAVLGHGVSAATLCRELLRWNDFARALGAFHQRFDLYLTPTTADTAPRHGQSDLPPALALALEGLIRSGLLRLLASTRVVARVVDAIARDNLAPVPFTQLANLTGAPAMSVPLGRGGDGLPLGIQFVGRMGDEATLLRLAAQLEQAAPWFERLPALAREDAATMAHAPRPGPGRA